SGQAISGGGRVSIRHSTEAGSLRAMGLRIPTCRSARRESAWSTAASATCTVPQALPRTIIPASGGNISEMTTITAQPRQKQSSSQQHYGGRDTKRKRNEALLVRGRAFEENAHFAVLLHCPE